MEPSDDQGQLFIRNYQSSDWDALYDICRRTGDRGGDANLTFKNPTIIPDVFAAPYLYLEPDLAFVLDDGRRPVGYVMGTADTAGFVDAYTAEWLPRLQKQYPEPAAPPFADRDELFLYLLYTPERMLVPGLLADYPSHLHIDILPPHQGKGFGRRLIEVFMGAAERAGASGVHVGVDAENLGGLGFYPRVGFRQLDIAAEGVVFFGRR